jgi:hypothetical protein
MKTKEAQKASILPVSMIGIMLLDEPGAPSDGIPTTIRYTAKGIQISRGWRRGKQAEIIARLKMALKRLEGLSHAV